MSFYSRLFSAHHKSSFQRPVVNMSLGMVIAVVLDDCNPGARISGTRISNLRFSDDISWLVARDIDLQISVIKFMAQVVDLVMVVSSTKTVHW